MSTIQDFRATAVNGKEQDAIPDDSATPRASSILSMNSLLAQALEVPSLNYPSNANGKYNGESAGLASPEKSRLSTVSSCSMPSTPTTSSNFLPDKYSSRTLTPLATPMDEVLPQHSDFTVPTRNTGFLNDDSKVDFSGNPPLEITASAMPAPPLASEDSQPRRSILGSQVRHRYHVPTQPIPASHSYASIPPDEKGIPGLGEAANPPPETPPRISYLIERHPMPMVSPLTPAHPIPSYKFREHTRSRGEDDDDILDEEDGLVEIPRPRRVLRRGQTFHETIHAQSLLLGLAFMAIWSPNNAMAPNLTQMADSFGMSEGERDLYLGSYCALALGVFCLPISALLGFMADFYSRKHLFVACVLGGSLASAWTGWSKTFMSLFLSRLISGGCMSASVPVAFSLLGDLFSTEERNAASSGLTAMMGLGIILGQVYAGMVGPTEGWQYPFFASSLLSLSTACLVILWVREPDRGAKEKALQEMLEAGNKYDRQLTMSGFIHAMRHNPSNSILLWQGFFTSLPWGIVFVFLNDYLSQEKGFSVQDATFMVMLFGVGCAIGGIVGGAIGQVCQERNRSSLPLFMAVSTFMGILPFVGLLNSNFPNKHGYKAMAYSLSGGCIASLPSVNARPCIINVNPPETRGAALTASNLLITLGRGIGPSCITLMGSLFNLSRQSSFNITLTLFWTITSIQLLFLAKTLPEDQDKMEAELAQYAASQRDLGSKSNDPARDNLAGGELGIEAVLLTPASLDGTGTAYFAEHNDGESLVSIEEYMTSFDGKAARRTIRFVQLGIKELKGLGYQGCAPCGAIEDSPEKDIMADEETMSKEELQKRRDLWKRQQKLLSQEGREDKPKTESTPLLHGI